VVFVVDTEYRPLSPCHPARARRLLTEGKAAVGRRYPFTIILKRVVTDGRPAPLRVKIDPASDISPRLKPGASRSRTPRHDAPGREPKLTSSITSWREECKGTVIPMPEGRGPMAQNGKLTGLALLNDHTGRVAWAAELTHRSQRIRDTLWARKVLRHGRRQRHSRYRPVRFNNRSRPDGWSPPSLESRISNVVTWVKGPQRLVPIGALSQEVARFDTQLMEKPEISGAECQQGELASYEAREYLLEKFGRKCAYCGAAGLPLQIDPVVAKARGGSHRVSNLTIACDRCNDAKGAQTAAEFGYPDVQARARRSPLDAAAVNASRWVLFHRRQATGLPVEVGPGGGTKWTRSRRGLPKAHWIDALCAGSSMPEQSQTVGIVPQLSTAMGRYSRQMCRTNAYGFPDKAPRATSVVAGMRTGDMVRAVAPAASIKVGVYVGRLAVRATGSCNIKTGVGRVEGIHIRYFDTPRGRKPPGCSGDACPSGRRWRLRGRPGPTARFLVRGADASSSRTQRQFRTRARKRKGEWATALRRLTARDTSQVFAAG
jgi:5-methylcytosine-specific restriction endonuclease McrA